jgi:hypothetical protein
VKKTERRWVLSEIRFVRPDIYDFVGDYRGDRRDGYDGYELPVAHYECDDMLATDANGNPIPRPEDVPTWRFDASDYYDNGGTIR